MDGVRQPPLTSSALVRVVYFSIRPHHHKTTMPARFVITTTDAEIDALFGLVRDANNPRPALAPRHNVAASHPIPVIRVASGTRELAELRLGLIPHWSSDPPPEGHVNARSETVAQKPSFRDAFRSRRCLVPVSGFYVWKPGPKRKQPYFFRPK